MRHTRLFAPILASLLACTDAPDTETDAEPPDTDVELLGEGARVWSVPDGFLVVPPAGPFTALQAEVDNAWIDVTTPPRRADLWFIAADAAPGATRWRLVDGQRVSPVSAAPTIGFSSDDLPTRLDANTELHPTLSIDDPFRSPLTVQVLRESHTTVGMITTQMQPTCADGLFAADCFDTFESRLPWPDPSVPAAIPWFTVPQGTPSRDVLRLTAFVAAAGVDGDLLEVALAEPREHAWMTFGREMKWGDLHAHSALSADGCEETDTIECWMTVYGDPGVSVYEHALDAGLDFAAMTEHAEWATVEDNSGSTKVIWDRQLELAAAAETADFIPIVGYEWTGSSPNGHYTVIFRDVDPCPSQRISALHAPENYARTDATYATRTDPQFVASAGDLSLALDELPGGCSQSLMFNHHGAQSTPQNSDWTSDDLVVDEERVRLVEVASEHGSSECRDLLAPGCDFQITDASRYRNQGSVQTALALGHEFGFVGGTDNHDGRPGSLWDGPSYADPDFDVHRQAWPGALTGVAVFPAYDRENFWRALLNRHTCATTGPRPEPWVWLLGYDDIVYIPGDVVPDLALPAHVVVSQAAEGYTPTTIELLSAGGETLASVDGGELDAELTSIPTAAYVRVRWVDDAGTEARTWWSPWFAE